MLHNVSSDGMSHYLNLLIIKFLLLCEYIYIVYFIPSSASLAIVSVNLNPISILNDTNFKVWKENVLIVLGYMDLDLALRVEQPPSLTNSNSSKEKSL